MTAYTCPYCHDDQECPGCIKGDGKMTDRLGYEVPCDVCDGTGRCPYCDDNSE